MIAGIVDEVKISAALKPGKYVLGFRYDCEATAQVWSNCADLELVASKSDDSAMAKPWPDHPVSLCCSNSKLNCSCPRAPPVNWDACPKWHVGNNTIGSGVYDASSVLRQPDGTWHMFPDGGKWAHCTRCRCCCRCCCCCCC